MTESFEMICIVCPRGCRLKAERTADGIAVTGNKCPRGAKFAEEEIVAPKRSFTGTVRSVFPEMPVVPVRTAGEVPKEKVKEVALLTRDVLLTRAYGVGEVAVDNVCGTGVDLIVTADMRKVIGS